MAEHVSLWNSFAEQIDGAHVTMNNGDSNMLRLLQRNINQMFLSDLGGWNN